MNLVDSQSHNPLSNCTLQVAHTPPWQQVIMPKRHEEYYFDDGSVILLVDGTLFRVHRYYFTRESQIFADMFSLPPCEASGSSGTREGQSDSSPIEIPGVAKQEMESFLGFVYFGMHDEHAPTLESWVALLAFSTRFVCDKIRARSIRELEAIQSRVDPIERVVLAVRHNIPHWLSGAYQELCQRQDSLSEDEGERLGLSTVIKLMRAREILLIESGMRDPRFFTGRVNRAPGMSSTSSHFTRMQLMDSAPVRPGWSSDDIFSPFHTGVEGRFDPQRVADVVREVFSLEGSPLS